MALPQKSFSIANDDQLERGLQAVPLSRRFKQMCFMRFTATPTKRYLTLSHNGELRLWDTPPSTLQVELSALVGVERNATCIATMHEMNSEMFAVGLATGGVGLWERTKDPVTYMDSKQPVSRASSDSVSSWKCTDILHRARRNDIVRAIEWLTPTLLIGAVNNLSHTDYPYLRLNNLAGAKVKSRVVIWDTAFSSASSATTGLATEVANFDLLYDGEMETSLKRLYEHSIVSLAATFSPSNFITATKPPCLQGYIFATRTHFAYSQNVVPRANDAVVAKRPTGELTPHVVAREPFRRGARIKKVVISSNRAEAALLIEDPPKSKTYYVERYALNVAALSLDYVENSSKALGRVAAKTFGYSLSLNDKTLVCDRYNEVGQTWKPILIHEADLPNVQLNFATPHHKSTMLLWTRPDPRVIYTSGTNPPIVTVGAY